MRDGLVTKDEIKKLVDRIAGRFRPAKVILYGSYATGTATPGSDLDILVVMPENGNIAGVARSMREAVDDFAVPVHVWAMPREQFEETREIVGGMAYPAAKYGVVVYEKS